jgi:hypothetical protein
MSVPPMPDGPDASCATAQQWADIDPILDMGEIGLETDTRRAKMGEGKRWSDTPYMRGLVPRGRGVGRTAQGNGNGAAGRGAGGGGAMSSGTAYTGGVGSAGCIIVSEYS